MKILVIDDSITMRRIIIKNLNSVGLSDVVEAENGEDALNKLEGVDLILTDWNMPVMNGLKFVSTMRRMEPYKDIPIIMITSLGSKGDVIEALKNGANDYIVKPFTSNTIIEKVKAFEKCST